MLAVQNTCIRPTTFTWLTHKEHACTVFVFNACYSAREDLHNANHQMYPCCANPMLH